MGTWTIRSSTEEYVDRVLCRMCWREYTTTLGWDMGHTTPIVAPYCPHCGRKHSGPPTMSRPHFCPRGIWRRYRASEEYDRILDTWMRSFRSQAKTEYRLSWCIAEAYDTLPPHKVVWHQDWCGSRAWIINEMRRLRRSASYDLVARISVGTRSVTYRLPGRL